MTGAPQAAVRVDGHRDGVPTVHVGLWSERQMELRSICDMGAIVVHGLTRQAWMRGRKLPLSPREAQVLIAIVGRHPGIVTVGEILVDIWGDDDRGGPDNPAELIRQYVDGARRVALARGFDLRAVYGQGYRAEALLPWRGRPMPIHGQARGMP